MGGELLKAPLSNSSSPATSPNGKKLSVTTACIIKGMHTDYDTVNSFSTLQ